MSDLPTKHSDTQIDELDSLTQDMYYEKAVQDRKEVDDGSRFYDTGTRIPGVQKAKNDNYMNKLKNR